MLLYEGPSLLDGTPIVVIATEDSNPKTGKMLFTWILRQDRPPEVAAYDGSDDAICGDCKFRALYPIPQGQAGDQRKAQQSRTCYVRLSHEEGADEAMPPSEVWRKWKAGEFQDAATAWNDERLVGVWDCFDGHMQYRGPLPVRIGSYGDPAAVPTRVWAELVRYKKHWTGYSHFYKPRKCTACAQESQTKVTCIDGGTVSTDNLQDVGSGMGRERGQDTDSCGIKANKPTPTGSHGSGSPESGQGSSGTPVTTRAVSTQDTYEAEHKSITCGTALIKDGTGRDSRGTIHGEKVGTLPGEGTLPETNRDNSCARCNGTGYEWAPDPDLKRYCMASVDTPEERDEAEALGWRTFTVVPEDDAKSAGVGAPYDENFWRWNDILCPATDPHPKRNATCATCLLCRGTSANAPSIWEVVHSKNASNHQW
jgi:hypothetical protein